MEAPSLTPAFRGKVHKQSGMFVTVRREMFSFSQGLTGEFLCSSFTLPCITIEIVLAVLGVLCMNFLFQSWRYLRESQIYIQSFSRRFCPQRRTRERTVKLRAIKQSM